ncbi:neurogenic locus notch homolog protein 1-like isoform X2 [Dreissena polymorpha]|uniref:neurogenic locus notch homolog protein 1-like isoform X2 n=1 Tax=Dreissena polymorpha TaxID=45954 RepID=UPI0022644D7B|nr:neurogenic locus notch homolog protein 1-like isoform X2 [Dreissena polymorpha]
MEKHWIVSVVYFAFLVHIAIQMPPVPCDYSICQQNNTCTLDNNRCSCKKGFQGPACTDDIDECLSGHSDPCGHRGECNNTAGGFECHCLVGWTGERCATNQTSDNITCMPGYYGVNCMNTTCDHGYPDPNTTTVTTVPTSIPSSTVCKCDDGWNKTRSDSPCDVDVNECTRTPSPCLHEGTCNNTIGSYHCECTGVWKGFDCSDYVTTTSEAITAEQTTVEFTELTTTEDIKRKSDNHSLTKTSNNSTDNATTDTILSLTDSTSTEARRSPFLLNRTTYDRATRPSLTTIPSNGKNEQKAKLKVWMIALISVGGILACVLLVALFVLKYSYSDSVANKMCSNRKRISNKVGVSLATMKGSCDLIDNKRQEVC